MMKGSPEAEENEFVIRELFRWTTLVRFSNAISIWLYVFEHPVAWDHATDIVSLPNM